MQHYLNQLHTDIAYASEHITFPFTEKSVDIFDWMSEEEEDTIAPVRNLQEWTGIYAEMLPPENLLTEEQVTKLCDALIQLLAACNCHFVMQMDVPKRIQYKTIRDNFNQEVKLKQLHMGFFELCKPDATKKQCALAEYCHCVFYDELFKDCIDEDLSPEEERARALEIELNHIKRKYGDDWMKYYPYHLDSEYDDENGKPYNYGFEDEEDNDNWWRK